MYIVVVGGGRVGFYLSRALFNAGHEVFIIERNGRRVDELVTHFGNVAIKGDGSEPIIQMAAGVARADILIATTGADEDNLAACQLAKHRFNVPKTVTLINSPEDERLFGLLGVDVVVSSTQLLLGAIEEELPAHSRAHVLPVQGNREAATIEVPQGSPVIGKRLSDIPLPPDTFVVAVVDRHGGLKELDEETYIELHDEIIAITVADQAEALLEVLSTRR
ncbi:MAG: TrkA family potassium uptake protein [Chloroflexi bacterium]|nr:TrkA family potassium uptake protein [Chloroflexota bacterium]